MAASTSTDQDDDYVKHTANAWLLLKLQHAVASGSDSLAYGSHDLAKAATCGAVAALLIRGDVSCDKHLTSTVHEHGGSVAIVFMLACLGYVCADVAEYQARP